VSRVLIVEDNRDIASGLLEHLQDVGFEGRVAGTGKEGLEEVRGWNPGVVILDLMLPDLSGYEVLQQMRSGGHMQPVLILSARSDEMAKVRGFRVGADDYVTKPFGLHELVERLRALARRSAANGSPTQVDVLRFGDLEIQLSAHRVLIGGVEAALRPKEYALLVALAMRPNQVVTRQFLLEHAWVYEPGVHSRTVDWHVAELRRKLGDDAETPRLIETVRKVGYRWAGGDGRQDGT